jgi:predicted phage terminase large subunit-like protein
VRRYYASFTCQAQSWKKPRRVIAKVVLSEADKMTRFSIASLSFEQGSVYLPREAPWLGEFLKELLGFPNVTFKDQVESVSQYLIWDRNRSKTTFEVFWT